MLKKGQLVRWVVDYGGFQADEDRVIKGIEPIYKYGIVMLVSQVNTAAIVVHSCGFETDFRLIILDGAEDDIEVLSKGVN